MSAIRRRTFRRRLHLERVEERLAPATFTVTTLTATGAGSLRAAVASANANSDADTIVFNTGLTGTININAGPLNDSSLDITNPVSIIGPGPDVLTVTANNESRVIDTSGSPAGAVISISGLGITGGRAIFSNANVIELSGCGGAVLVQNEIVTITNCKISGNTADRSGGGIAVGEHRYLGSGASARLTVQSCSITGNIANNGSGGGISVYGESFDPNATRYQSLLVIESVISGNTCTSSDTVTLQGGGGVAFRGKTAAGGYLSFLNTTIVENQALNAAAGGAIAAFDLQGTLSLLHSTVAHNKSTTAVGGGIRFQDRTNHGGVGNLGIFSSIISNNTSIDGTSKRDISSKYLLPVGAEFSLIGVGNAGNFDLTATATLTGTEASPLDAKLGALTDNGGPTLTRMPLPGSPAISTGSVLLTTSNDGRGPGYPRVLDTKADIGAVEYTDWVVRNNNSSGSGSLAQRIQDANAFTGQQTITFEPVVFPTNKSTTLSIQADTPIADSLTIAGPGSAALTLQRSAGIDSLFNVAKFASFGEIVTMSGLTFKGGLVNVNGGVIRARDQVLNFTDCVFTSTEADNGGAIAFESSTGGRLNLLRCSFTNNIAEFSGGAVFFAGGGSFSIIDSTFSGNQTKSGASGTQGGGAVAFVGTAAAPLLVRNSTFSGNTTTNHGGAIFLTSFAGTLNVQHSTIAGNSASGTFGGGGIGRTASSGTITLDNSILSNNVHTAGNAEDLFSSGEVNATFSAIGIPVATINGDAFTNNFLGKNFYLGTLGNYGGPTQTIPLLPGSPLFHAANTFVGFDQRGLPRVSKGDIGAFESQGITLKIVSGTPQSVLINQPFSPLVVNVVAENLIEPVDGGVVGFFPPESGASATVGSPLVVIASGSASTTATANSIGGSYVVLGAITTSTITFDLTNKAPEAPSLVVTTTSDVVDQFDNKTSLREAVALANSQAGTDTITFSPTVFATPQTITLTGGELALNAAVAIVGPGAALTTVSGDKASRIFNTTAAPSNTAITVAGLTLANGSAPAGAYGGAVFANGQDLTFNDCVLTGNTAFLGGAIGFNSTATGSLSLQRCTLSGNTATAAGGAVGFYNGGGFNVQNSTLSGNQAQGTSGVTGGGGIYFFGSASSGSQVTNSTIANNSASRGGGVGLVNFDGTTLIVANSTIVGNTASGSSGGGGIARVAASASGQMSILSSIVSNNKHTVGAAPDFVSTNSSFISLSASAIGSTTGLPAGSFVIDGTTTSLLGQDFRLSPVGAYGGSTQTYALLPGSPAINKGTNVLSLSTDQRGQPRVAVGTADIGAFESQGFTVSVVSGTPQTTKVSSAFANPLVAKVAAVNAVEPVNGGVLTFAAPGSGASATLGSPAAVIAAGSASTIATANATGGAYNVTASVPGSSVNFALTNQAPEAPSLVVTTSADVLDSFDNKTSLREALAFANGTPGADTITFDPVVFASAQTITLANTLSVADAITITGPGANLLTVSGNKAVRVITIDTPSSGQKIALTGLTITDGFSNQRGGGLDIGDESVLLQDCAVVNNSASTTAGAIHVGPGAKVVLERCTVSGNSANTNGAIYSGSPLVIRNSTIANNTATTSVAGAIGSGGSGNLLLEYSSVVGNKAGHTSGGIRSNGTFTSTGSVISGNTVGGTASDVSFLVLGQTVIAANSAIGVTTPAAAVTDNGGNILNQPHASLKLGSLADNGGPTQTIAILPGSPLINRGSNPAGLTTDQRGAGFPRVVGGATDIGAFESNLPATVRSVVVNGGAVQRSRVTSLTVTFDRNIGTPGAGAFALRNQATSLNPILAVATDNSGPTTVVTLTFSGPSTENGSLADGRYSLFVFASGIAGGQFDGNIDGVAGDNYALDGNPTNGLFRLFGDADGDGDVDAVDYGAFRGAFGGANPAFDFDGDGDVDALDFGQFRVRFGASV